MPLDKSEYIRRCVENDRMDIYISESNDQNKWQFVQIKLIAEEPDGKITESWKPRIETMKVLNE
jgi:hypothetical protein